MSKHLAASVCFCLAGAGLCSPDEPDEYVFIPDTDRWVEVCHDKTAPIGQLDDAGNFLPFADWLNHDRGARHSGLGRWPEKLNYRAEKDVYEFRSGRLIKGEIDARGYFVPEIGSKVIDFKDYHYHKGGPRIWNLPGRFEKVLDVIKQARLLEDDGEFDKAIPLYESLVQRGGDHSVIPGHLKELKARWLVKDDNHRHAREFIYVAWPKYRAAVEVQAHLEEAQKGFEVCRAAGDKLSPVRLLKANIVHMAQLNMEAEKSDRSQSQTIADLVLDLRKLNDSIKSFIGEPQR